MGNGPVGRLYKMAKEHTIVERDDLQQTTLDLERSIGAEAAKVKAHTQEAVDEIRNRLQAVADQAAKNAADINQMQPELRAYTEDCVAELRGHFMESFESLRSGLTTQLDSEVADMVARVSEAVEEMSRTRAGLEDLEERLRLQKSELTKDFKRELSTVLDSRANEQDQSIKVLEESLESWKKTFDRHERERTSLRNQHVNMGMLESMKQDTAEKIRCNKDEVMSTIRVNSEKQDAHIGRVEAKLLQEMTSHGATIDQEISRFRQDAEQRLACMENDASYAQEAIASAVSATTRSVEWVVPDNARHICAPQSWMSPRFSAGGVSGLQLELQVVPKATPVESLELPKAKKELLESAALTTLEARINLWAGGGVQFAFRISLAGSQGTAQEAHFDSWSPCSAGRTWKLDDRLARDDCTLRVVVEILSTTTTIESHVAQMTARRSVPHGSRQDSPQQLPELAAPRFGVIRALRHIDNCYEQHLRSSMVRRIEWRLEQASSLKALFPKGECIVTNTFSAAGMDNLQLIFYPLGCVSAPSGYCSFFMRCKDAIPRAWLHVGKHRVEALHEDVEPDWVGRVKFWHADKFIDPETDSVVLAFEVFEAPGEVLHVSSSNDPRRSVRKCADGRPSSRPRAKSSRKRPPSDSTLVQAEKTNQWVKQAYIDGVHGNTRSVTPSRQTSPAFSPVSVYCASPTVA